MRRASSRVVATAPKHGNFRDDGDLPSSVDMPTCGRPARAGLGSCPDQTVCHRLWGCGCGLGGVPDLRIERSRQVRDLAPVAVGVIRHDVRRYGYGREHAGALPGDVPAGSFSYEVNLETRAACLIIYHHVPV